MNTKVKTKRNGKIELLRFVFCLGIVLFHLNYALYSSKLSLGPHLSFFNKGNLAVEFFFLVSGFLLAKTALRPDTSDIPIGSQTVSFIKRKILAFFSPHTISFILTFSIVCIAEGIRRFDVVRTFIRALPGYFLLNKSGFSMKIVNGAEWYIGAMILVMLFVFPLCKKYKTLFTNVIAPVVSVFILGYLFHKYGGIANVKEYDVWTFKCILRSIADICLGTTAYSISKKLSEYNFSLTGKIILTVSELLCILFSFYFIISKENSKYGYLVIMALFTAIIIIFSNQSLGNDLFNNRFCRYLGRLSLPVYLIQTFARLAVVVIAPGIIDNVKLTVIVVTAATLICGVGLMYLSVPLDKLVNKTLSKINSAD